MHGAIGLGGRRAPIAVLDGKEVLSPGGSCVLAVLELHAHGLEQALRIRFIRIPLANDIDDAIGSALVHLARDAVELRRKLVEIGVLRKWAHDLLRQADDGARANRRVGDGEAAPKPHASVLLQKAGTCRIEVV